MAITKITTTNTIEAMKASGFDAKFVGWLN